MQTYEYLSCVGLAVQHRALLATATLCSVFSLLSIKLLKQRDQAVRLHLPHYWRDAGPKAELGCYFVRKGMLS